MSNVAPPSYPDYKIDFLRDDGVDLHSPDHQRCTASLHLRPEIFPIKRYPQFDDALNPGAPGLNRMPP